MLDCIRQSSESTPETWRCCSCTGPGCQAALLGTTLLPAGGRCMLQPTSTRPTAVCLCKPPLIAWPAETAAAVACSCCTVDCCTCWHCNNLPTAIVTVGRCRLATPTGCLCVAAVESPTASTEAINTTAKSCVLLGSQPIVCVLSLAIVKVLSNKSVVNILHAKHFRDAETCPLAPPRIAQGWPRSPFHHQRIENKTCFCSSYYYVWIIGVEDADIQANRLVP